MTLLPFPNTVMSQQPRSTASLSHLGGLGAGVELDLAVGALEAGGAVAHVAALGRGGGAPAAVGARPVRAVGGHGAAVCGEEEAVRCHVGQT